MNSQIPQITRRRIGSVMILDLKGELVGPWALKAKENISHLLIDNTLRNLLINLKELITIDSLGVKAVAENLLKSDRSGLIQGKHSVMEMFTRLHVLNERIKVFQDEDEVVEFFGKDFIEDNHLSFIEKRVHERLKTAIPLEFWYCDKAGKKIVFKAIITDLSVGGLFAEYLDLETVDAFHKDLDPYELQKLHLRMKIPGYEHIMAEGKVLRTIISGEQLGLGVEFTSIDENDRSIIAKYLD